MKEQWNSGFHLGLFFVLALSAAIQARIAADVGIFRGTLNRPKLPKLTWMVRANMSPLPPASRRDATSWISDLQFAKILMNKWPQIFTICPMFDESY
jgi:hypothetical protein